MDHIQFAHSQQVSGVDSPAAHSDGVKSGMHNSALPPTSYPSHLQQTSANQSYGRPSYGSPTSSYTTTPTNMQSTAPYGSQNSHSSNQSFYSSKSDQPPASSFPPAQQPSVNGLHPMMQSGDMSNFQPVTGQPPIATMPTNIRLPGNIQPGIIQPQTVSGSSHPVPPFQQNFMRGPGAFPGAPTPGMPGMSYRGPPPIQGTQYRPGPQPRPGLPPPPPTNIQGVAPPDINNRPPPPMSQSHPGSIPPPSGGQGLYGRPPPPPQMQTQNSMTNSLTPSNSAPASQRSSRTGTPVNTTNYDYLEGQFPSTPVKGIQSPNVPDQQVPYMSPYQQNETQTPPPPPISGFPQVLNSAVPSGGRVYPQAPPSNHVMPGPPQGGPPGTYPNMPGQQQGSLPGTYPNMPGQQQGSLPGTYPNMPGQQQGSLPGTYPNMPGQQQGSLPGTYPNMPGQQQSSVPGTYPNMPGQQQGSLPGTYPNMPGQPSQQGNFAGTYPGLPGQHSGNLPGSYPNMPGQTQGNFPSTFPGSLNSGFNNLSLQPDHRRPLNLLQERNILPPEGVEVPVPNLPNEYLKANCSPEVMSCTLNAIPNTQSLLHKTRLPLGLLIHPFKDLSLPVIQSSVIVRCRQCRTYINPFIAFVDSGRWKCNICFRLNDLPEEFSYDPVSKTYGEPQRRPEVKSATIEYVAPSEYMLRPPQPAVYLYLLDVSFNAVETGYLEVFCQTFLDELDKIPGDKRTQIGFITFDTSLHFYNLSEELSQPQMYVITDLEEVCLPCPDGLMVNLQGSKTLIVDLLKKLPSFFKKNLETSCALGSALEIAYKLMGTTGGRISVVQTHLPTIGSGALKCREDPNERTGKTVHNLGAVTDFYKKLSLDCSAQQIAVDLFLLNSQYSDIATIACVAKYSGGSLHYFPGFHTITNPAETQRFESTLRRYFTRKIGFESVMRIRCTKGINIHTFHGNFFVRSTDLLSLPNVNPDAGYGMQMSIDDTLDCNYVSFQAALLYTSSRAERRIRVHTLCIPVSSIQSEIHMASNQQAIIGLLSKMAVDKSLNGTLSDAREAMVNAAIDIVGAYGSTLPANQRVGQLPCCYPVRLVPVYILAMLKSCAFRIGINTRLDDRVVAMEQCKTLPLIQLMKHIHPDLYPVHNLDEKNLANKDDNSACRPPLIPLSSTQIDRHGAYIMDTGSYIYLYLGAAISDGFCRDVLDVGSFQQIVDGTTPLPVLDNPTSQVIRNFCQKLNEQRPFAAPVIVIREDGRLRLLFQQHLIEDRSESTLSYQEFLQHIQKEMKS